MSSISFATPAAALFRISIEAGKGSSLQDVLLKLLKYYGVQHALVHETETAELEFSSEEGQPLVDGVKYQ